jgi:hypothetical protein
MKVKALGTLLLGTLCTGCTTLALENSTLAQIQTIGDLRDREVLHCLAQVAADPDALPSFAVSSDGTTRITDQVSFGAITTWSRAVNGFSMQSLSANPSRSPLGTWTVDTVGDFERLEALRCACLWALRGGPQCRADCEILEDPRQHPNGRPHFGVADRLARLPVGWIGAGGLKDVPCNARHKAHCGSTWVWVLPEHAEAFAQFELAVLDIALLDYATIYFPRLLVTLVRDDATKVPDVTDATKKQAVSVQEVRAVKPEYLDAIESALRKGMRDPAGRVQLTYAQWMEYTEPYHNPRTTQQSVLVTVPSAGALPFQVSPPAPTRTPDRSNRTFRIE